MPYRSLRSLQPPKAHTITDTRFSTYSPNRSISKVWKPRTHKSQLTMGNKITLHPLTTNAKFTGYGCPKTSSKKNLGKGTNTIIQLNPPCHTQQQHPRWVCKDLLLTQGYYKGNAKLWIPKQNPLQAIILHSTNPCNKGKTVSQVPLSPPTTGRLHTP